MAIDTTPSTVATSALQAIPFGSLIGGPLEACIKAQATAARMTSDFINTVGFDESGKSKNLVFEYQRDGKIVTMIVPTLLMVPIPYIQIDAITIDFMANISAASSSVSENAETTSMGGELGVEAKVGWGPFSATANFKANYSSKKDSKATQESRYSVEYTMNVHVGASQSSMPTGLATILNILQGSITGSTPGGELTVSPKTSTLATRASAAYFEFTVVDSGGLLVPEQEINITLQAASGNLKLKNIGIAPGTAVGTPTATTARAKANEAGVVGVTIEIDPTSPASKVNVLKLAGNTSIKLPDGSSGSVKTATAQLTVPPQGPVPSLLTVNPEAVSGAPGAALTFKAVVTDPGGNPIANKKVDVASANPAIATVSPASLTTGTDGATGNFSIAITSGAKAGDQTSITATSDNQPVPVLVTSGVSGEQLTIPALPELQNPNTVNVTVT